MFKNQDQIIEKYCNQIGVVKDSSNYNRYISSVHKSNWPQVRVLWYKFLSQTGDGKKAFDSMSSFYEVVSGKKLPFDYDQFLAKRRVLAESDKSTPIAEKEDRSPLEIYIDKHARKKYQEGSEGTVDFLVAEARKRLNI